MRRHITIAALLAVAVVGLSGCLDTLSLPGHDNPLDPSNPATSSSEPARPTGLTAVVSDRLVELSWTVSDTFQIELYRVYRWEVEDEDEEDYELIDTSEETGYDDSDVRNGQIYYYQVSSVNRHGLEGEASREVGVIPRVFGITIDQGRPKVASRNVTLAMSASVDADLMQVSNDPDMTGAAWEPYSSSRSWILEPGDGMRTVYARFRDTVDNMSGIVSDDIEVDTRATIEVVTEDTGGEDMSAGDVIHFTLIAGELYGVAMVDVGSVVPGIELFDDGTGGDDTPLDGVYERDYAIEQGVEVIDGAVVGTFTDDIGNAAEPVAAAGMVTILDPPTAVEMDTPVPLTERSIALSWSRNNDSDFSAYKLYRSYIPGVDSSSDRELIGDISDQTDTDFTDTGLDPSTTYYYAVYVIDRAGLTSVSNEVAGTTVANEAPTAVELFEPWAPGGGVLEVSWSRNDDDDFEYYELIGWEEEPPGPPATSGKRVLARITDRDDTFFTHESLSDTIIYWYEVAVADSFGAVTVSNSEFASP